MHELPLPPSPGALEHPSIDLVNSVIRLPGDVVVDAIETPADATSWLIERGLAAEGSMLESYCQNRLLGMREDLREAFAAAVDGVRLGEHALDRINAAMKAAPQIPLLGMAPGGGFVRVPEHPVTQVVEQAMSVIAEDAATLLTGDEAPLLARCEAEPCIRFFLRTHARRQWCSTRCGDRVRAARAYARKKEAAAADARG
ncbi:CGNR zinc finger domain-containing protein [Gulosibacter massiliensis]|uniref:CGNR zinc finger domain-containing protein n=1 Tax=Gulosibacter massiliensis TaxID=2479839 RepID=UPI000F63073E|nr:CGNR zinc finger domain-containing protein [Gulosibacter massiliensis]